MTTLFTTEPVPEGTDLVVTVARDDWFLDTSLYRAYRATWSKLDPEDSLAADMPYWDMPAPVLVERDRMSGYLALTTTGGEPIAGDNLAELPDRSILAAFHAGSGHATVLQKIHGEWWGMETPMTEYSGDVFTDESLSRFYDQANLLWRADIDSIPQRPDRRRSAPLPVPPPVPPRPTRESLRGQLLELIPAPVVSQNIRDWPDDEADFHRNGFASPQNPDGWNSFTNRAERLELIRRDKVADAILALLQRQGLLP